MTIPEQLKQLSEDTAHFAREMKYVTEKMQAFQTALTNKIYTIEDRLNNKEGDLYDAVAEIRADNILKPPLNGWADLEDINKMLGKEHDQHIYNMEAIANRVRGLRDQVGNPAMDRQEFPDGMVDIKTPEVAKEWEILEFRNSKDYGEGRSWTLRDNGIYKPFGIDKGGCILGQMLYMVDDPHAEIIIWKVKKISDGSIHTVGEKSWANFCGEQVITSFLVTESQMDVVFFGDRSIAISGVSKITPKAPKEWEILQFKTLNNDVFFTWDPSRLFYIGNGSYYTLNEMFETGAIIHTVCRLSDDVVFSVGDSFKLQDSNIMESITRFSVNANLMYVHADLLSTPIRNIEKPVRVFTTADGVEVPEFTTVYYFDPGNGLIHVGFACAVLSGPYFSTRTAAEDAYEEWLYDQPVLTINDVIGQLPSVILAIVKKKIAKP